jgi:L-threonylcarbamoyladenylate synthase
MKTEILAVHDPRGMPRALEILQSGGLVAFPTDTVYGLGALAFDGEAVKRIYAAKDRPVEKAIPVLIGDQEDLGKVCSEIPKIALQLAACFWPGPLTMVVPKCPELPEAVSAGPTIGVRIPDHQAARSFLRLSGPMAVTSANLSGRQSPSTAQEVLDQLGGRIALILDGGKTPGGVPSTVVDCTGAVPKVLRIGSISKNEILAELVKKI